LIRHLRVDGNLIGADLAEEIFDELTVVNTDKEFAKKTNRWGWQDLPDDFLLAELDGDTVVMPRGYAFQLKTLLRAKGLRVQWEDHRRWQHGPALNGSDGLSLKPHQQRAVRKIIRHQQGMYEAPTGAGKTVTCVGFMMAKLPYRTLILVDQLGLLNQWRKEIARWTGLNIDDIGQIGDGSGMWVPASPSPPCRRSGVRLRTTRTRRSLWTSSSPGGIASLLTNAITSPLARFRRSSAASTPSTASASRPRLIARMTSSSTRSTCSERSFTATTRRSYARQEY
jgi:hypothetical protein